MVREIEAGKRAEGSHIEPRDFIGGQHMTLIWLNQFQSVIPRRREGGFSFEVQQFGQEDLGGAIPVKTFSGGVVVGANEGAELTV